MSNSDHTFDAVKKEKGEVKDIKAYENVCSKCHSNKQELINEINRNRRGFEASLEIIKEPLAKKGIHYNPLAYPYFYPSPRSLCAQSRVHKADYLRHHRFPG